MHINLWIKSFLVGICEWIKYVIAPHMADLQGLLNMNILMDKIHVNPHLIIILLIICFEFKRREMEI